MSAHTRAAVVVAVVAIATFGEGGASAASLLAQHLLLAFGVAVCAVVFPPSDHAPARGPAVAWSVFAILAGAGALVAPYAYAAWLVMIEIMAFGSMAWLASGAPHAVARALPPALAVLTSLHAIAAIAQKLTGSRRAASTFLNPNHLAAWLAAAMLFLAAQASGRSATARARWIYGGASLLALSGILLTGSRGAALGLAVGAAVLVASMWSEMSQRTRRATILLVVAAGIAMSAAIAARFRSHVDPYAFHRTKIWGASVRTLASSPLLGSGPGQFPTAVSDFRFPIDETPLRFERGFRTPHSDVLRSVCEFGLPAGLAALAAVGLGLSWTLEKRRTLATIERGALVALAALLAQSFVDDLSTRPAITLTGAALAGLLLSRKAKPFSRTAAIAVSALLTMALGIGEIAGYIGFAQAAELPRGPLTPPQLAQLTRSLRLSPMRPDGWQRLAEHYVGDGRSWTLSDYASAREATERAQRLQPEDAYYARGAARVEAQACLTILPFTECRERAVRLYDHASDLARWDATIPFEASRFLLRAADPAGAKRAAERALRIEPKAAAPRLCLARAILNEDGAAGAGRARELLDEAETLALPPGGNPSSPYDAALRSIDPGLRDSIRRDLGD